MTLGNIDTKITQETGADTSSTGYPSATRAIDINSWKHIVQTMIRDSQDESDFDDQTNSTYPIKYLSLVAAQRDYSIPVSEKVVGVKRIDITYDGVNYVRATPIDSGEIIEGMGLSTDSTQESTTDGQYSTNAPSYDFKYNAVFIYPRATTAQVNAGAKMKIEWEREMVEYTTSDLTTGTAVPGFDSAFHPFLYLGPSYDYAMVNQLPQAKGLKERLNELEARLRRHYGSKEKDRDMVVKSAVQSYK